jgi:predicted DsbA family dithiol-disulfide isomerase
MTTGLRAIVAIVTAGAGLAIGIACNRSAQGSQPAGAAALATTAAARPDAVVATVAGKPITAGEVETRLGNRLLRLRVEEYTQRHQVLQEMIATALLENEAARRHATVRDLLQQEVEKKARPVADEEAGAVYEALPDRFRGVAQADAMRSIAESMRRQRVNQRRQAFTKELERAAGVRVLLEPPRINIDSSGGPSRGPADALVTIVEFSDFQCPYCAQMARILHQLDAQYPGKVRLVFRHFPLPMHKDAATAAEAAACAGDQGKYWEMHDRLFAGQKNLTRSDLGRYAADLGLQATRFAACLDSGKHAADWQKDRADGERYGVTGTPALFVNGRPVFGAATMLDLGAVIDEELERAQSLSAKRLP